MRPLRQAIEETASLGKKLLAENPTLHDVSFQLSDYPSDEVMAVAGEYRTTAEFFNSSSRFGFLASFASCSIYVHVRSVEVKAKLVYE